MLREQTDKIEDELDHEIYWGEIRKTSARKMRSNLGVRREADIANREQWDEYFDWMLEMGERFHDVFPDKLRQIS